MNMTNGGTAVWCIISGAQNSCHSTEFLFKFWQQQVTGYGRNVASWNWTRKIKAGLKLLTKAVSDWWTCPDLFVKVPFTIRDKKLLWNDLKCKRHLESLHFCWRRLLALLLLWHLNRWPSMAAGLPSASMACTHPEPWMTVFWCLEGQLTEVASQCLRRIYPPGLGFINYCQTLGMLGSVSTSYV